MAIVLASSDSAPVNSDIICCTTVTDLNMLCEGELFTFGVLTDLIDLFHVAVHFSKTQG
jgi:hypothetical protein